VRVEVDGLAVGGEAERERDARCEQRAKPFGGNIG
jgi:hypothetical protein